MNTSLKLFKPSLGIILACSGLFTPYGDIYSNELPFKEDEIISIVLVKSASTTTVKVVRCCQKRINRLLESDKIVDYKLLKDCQPCNLSLASIESDTRFYYKLTFQEGKSILERSYPDQEWTDFVYRIHENIDPAYHIDPDNIQTREITLSYSDDLVNWPAILTLYVRPEAVFVFEDSTIGVKQRYFKTTYKDLN